jgi:hypothetical protein
MSWLKKIIGIEDELKPSGLAKSKAGFDYSNLSKSELDKIGMGHLWKGDKGLKKDDKLEFDIKNFIKEVDDDSIRQKKLNSDHIKDIKVISSTSIRVEFKNIKINYPVEETSVGKHFEEMSAIIDIEDSKSKFTVLPKYNFKVSYQIFTDCDIRDRYNLSSDYKYSQNTLKIYSSYITLKCGFSNDNIIDFLKSCINEIKVMGGFLNNISYHNLKDKKIRKLTEVFLKRREVEFKKFVSNMDWVEDCLISIEDMGQIVSRESYGEYKGIAVVNPVTMQTEYRPILSTSSKIPSHFTMVFGYNVPDIQYKNGRLVVNRNITQLFRELNTALTRIESRISNAKVSLLMNNGTIDVHIEKKYKDIDGLTQSNINGILYDSDKKKWVLGDDKGLDINQFL